MFKKRIILLSSIFVFLSSLLLGQDYFVSNIYNNTVFSNPSFALFHDYSLAQINYRNQWPVSQVYTSYGASYFHNAKNLNSNFGAIINYDNQYKGSFTKTSVGINYAYKLQISRKSHFLFGLQAYYNFDAVNYSNLTFENQNFNIPANKKSQYPSINSGIALLLRNVHFIGISAKNMYNFSGSNENELLLNATYIGKIPAKGYYSEIKYEPLINLSTNLSYLNVKYGGNIDFSGLKAGLLLSQTNFKFNTLVILLGISFENYDFIYTYDLNLSGAITINPKMAGHEVTFLTKFQYKGRSNRRGAIKCPDI